MVDMTERMQFVSMDTFKCECCKQSSIYKEKYKWTLWFGNDSLMICKKCAIREAFGTKYKQNKRYIQWMERRSK